ncbi:PIN domain-containing protein [uncultured Thiodictyon sp.]|uniref:PIN domain-containing protein n=1 Tax=uncultured Thiodictyon sp. TaxID=1846217 RepID=UPI0025F6A9DC|nr:PIN domain-containing protein [uncultured Thiodictyon sp.]
MRIYLDVCAFNRPFDDQKHIRVRLEAEAKLYVQGKIKAGEVELVWSYILDLENDQNPFREKRLAIEEWRKYSIAYITESDEIIDKANEFVRIGLKPKDALHVSSAIAGEAKYFMTTDDKLLKKIAAESQIVAINPISLAAIIDERIN